MTKEFHSLPAGNTFKISGTIRDQHQQLMPGLIVRAYNQNIRGRHLLSEAITDSSGFYVISYTRARPAMNDVIVIVYDENKSVLKESDVHINPPELLQLNINLNGKPLAGISVYEQLVNKVAPYAGDIPLSELTETDKIHDISFIAKKTRQSKERIEKLAMAARFETFSSIPINIWYGILHENLPDLRTSITMDLSRPRDFETRLETFFDGLMHTNIDVLMSGLQKAISENIIAYAVTADLQKVRKQLVEQVQAYARQHPVTGSSSELYQKAKLGGLKGKELQSFVEAHNNHTGTEASFWLQAKKHPALKKSEKMDLVEAVFNLSRLTGDNLALTEKLVKSKKIKSTADIKKLAAYDRSEWEALAKVRRIKPAAAVIAGKSPAEQAKPDGSRLEASFTREFPTAAFAARLEKDTRSKMAHRDKVTNFFKKNEHFDLLHDHVGKFLEENKEALVAKDAPGVASQLRRIQRVFKLAPEYNITNLLLDDNIHSAHQVYRMGEDNFVKTYGEKIGPNEAITIFQKASNVHSSAVALVGNLKSMAHASTLKAFPNYSQLLGQQLVQELPSLETLFGHTDFCECSECRSVYGAPAYLTDILHFLGNRISALPATAGKTPSVKDILLSRRPDIADIDLECSNSNTVIPYIDIACEIMEDYIAAPVAVIASSFLAMLVKGKINAALLAAVKGQFLSTGQANISNLLTTGATLSAPYTVNHLLTDNSYLTQTHWVVRDNQVTLRATSTLGIPTIEFRLLHQALLPSEAISASPEYINTNAYKLIKAAKRPFSLPFDLFETEGELYLEKLGVKKADLIDTFRKEDKLPAGTSPADLGTAYAALGINDAEQALIFVADPTHQSVYWGAAALTTAIQTNLFENLTGLNYSQVVNLIKLQFINPLKDSTIEHDDLSSDTTRQRITNLSPVKLDAIHRFLRIWRKTALTMEELDSIIMSPIIGKGVITNKLAWQLQQFTFLQQKLQLTAFELLAFYQNLDITHNYPDCLYNRLFQNSAITNPVSPDFSIAAVTPGTLGITEMDKSVIAAVLLISIDDVNSLVAKTFSRLSFPPLSLMFRYAKLAKSLEITVSDLLTLVNLIDANPFLDLPSTCEFLQKYKLLIASGFSIDDLNYLLRHQDNSNHTLVPSNNQVSASLGHLQVELLAVRAAAKATVDQNGLLLTDWLSNPSFNWDSSLLNKLVDILNTVDDDEYQKKIDNNANFLLNLRLLYHDAFITADLPALPLTTATPPTPVIFPASISPQLSYDQDKKQLLLSGYMSAADLAALRVLSTDASYLAALNFLYLSAQLTDSTAANTFFTSAADISASLRPLLSGKTSDRFAIFINKLAPVYLKLLQQDVLVKNISTWFGVDKKIASQLLASVPPVYPDLTDDNFVNKVTVLNNPAGPYPVQFSRYLSIAKTCFVAGKLKLTEADLSFLLTHAADIGSLNFSVLPLAPIATAATTFPGFETMVNLLRFEQYYPAKLIAGTTSTTVSIYGILLDAINQGVLTPAQLITYTTSLVTNLVSLTGWNAADLTALIGNPNYLTLKLPADIKSVAVLLRLHQIFVMLRQLGVPATDAVTWCKSSLLIADSTKIKQTLKLKYSNNEWLEVTQPLQDKLREKKRDALINFLLANPGTQSWNDANDLYNYFLLDVEMCSCQPTSRIVQATNSVQLFVQRCFLKLENSVTVNSKTDSSWLQWKWMKNFRVWQANIKVFLYPENWIEPELLPDEIKSPFLKDLENDLLQNEVTASSAADAFQNYLVKLDGVARLEIKGMWYDDGSKTLHVFGRTYGGNPKTYYYRRFINGKRWTPWEKIDVDITSDHIIPVIYNNRVYLFWAIFNEQFDSSQMGTIPPAGFPNYVLTQPHKNWLIQMAFSEYKNGRWTPKKVSDSDDSGQIFCSQTDFPVTYRFLFTPLDIPLFDYGNIFDENGVPRDSQQVFAQKTASAVQENGTLIINCYFYKLIDTPENFNNCIYVGSFQLDPVKGYPALAYVPYQVRLPQSSNSTIFNMLDTESTWHHHHPPHPNNLYLPDQSKGTYRNLIPIQMGLSNRADFLQNIYKNGSTAVDVNNQLVLGQLLPYFYQDSHRTYFVLPEFSDNGTFEFFYTQFADYQVIFLEKGEAEAKAYYDSIAKGAQSIPLNHYYNFHHPLVDYFIRQLFAKGLDGMMDRDTQLKGDIAYDQGPGKFSFKDYLQPGAEVYSGSLVPVTYPNGVVDAFPGYPRDDVDFSLQSGYGLYNWEIFFHAPLMIAERLSQNHQFEAADRWYKYIFNPVDTSGYDSPNKYWNTKPFFFNVNADYVNQRIENILKGINGKADDLIQDVADWRNNPFQPHYIAQYRTVAYQKTAVMKYIGHLVRHGDYLFSQHTMESVNEATQLYILASEILGPKPQVIPPAFAPTVDNYYQLEQKLDAFSDAMVDIENLMPLQTIKGYTGTVPGTPAMPSLQTLYFCIPMNENMAGPTGYWDIVADRLFKIRHCMDIEGTFAPLSIFAPAIDPGMLVRASAAGLDIGSILKDTNAALPLYRFMVMLQKAAELCSEVKSLGAALLSAMEKKDAETMALLHSGHEIKMLGATLLVKQKQIQDAQLSLDNLGKLKELTTIRQKYYTSLINEGLTAGEIAALTLNVYSGVLQAGVSLAYVLGATMHAIPSFTIGVSGLGSPVATSNYGGAQLGDSVESAARSLTSIAAVADKGASIINTTTSYGRRADEWQYQLDLANKELEQIEKQLLGAHIRLDIAMQDLSNQQLQTDQAKEANDFMHSKFTNEDLFNWMITQISGTYFKSYQLAYDIAKQAERCFRYELGLPDSAYINFGYWDSLKKGLLAGEQLSYDIKKMEMAYYELNQRELELIKPISLSQLDAVALLKLKTTGECWINLPEELFDMDYPGHYLRRIKSVSITIPCISGPYTTVSCKLTMTKNSVRTSGIPTSDPAQYSRKLSNGVPTDDPRFRDAIGALQSIATSGAQNDSGLFELNFRDERYLPFEGAGAISMWHLQLPAAIRQFDYNTISDVIIHLKYTARDGGESLKANAAGNLTSRINQMLVSTKDKGLMRIFSAKNDLPTEWYRFLHPANTSDDQVLTLLLDNTRFPLFVQGKAIKIKSIELIGDSQVNPLNKIQVISPASAPDLLGLTATGIYGNWLSGSIDYSNNKKDPGTWLIKNPVANARLTDSMLNNLVIIVHYEVS